MAIPHYLARESDERICVRKRWKTAGILCVFQGFPNAFLAERIRQNPKTQLCGVAIVLPGQNPQPPQEAETIAALMQACFEQPEFAEESFGVISLLGDEQATLRNILQEHDSH